MRPKELPPLEVLRLYYKYNPHTGGLIKIRKTSQRCKLEVPCGSLSSEGYLKVSLKGSSYPVHRICYKLFYGKEPEIIDHIDGNKTNNKIDNIRSVSYKVNNRNRLKAKGVSKIKSGSYRAVISIGGVRQDIGYFQDEKSAIDAYNEKRRELGWII